jgi:hypothetical protein
MSSKPATAAEPVTGRNAAQRIAKMIRPEFHDRNAHEVFGDWLTMCAMTLANVNGTKAPELRDSKWDEREETFTKTQARYSNEKQRHAFGVMLGILMAGSSNSRHNGEFRDILGETFEALELMNEHAGQFFTPSDVADLMAQLTVDEAFVRETLRTKRFVTMDEPAVGSGRTVLPLVRMYHGWRLDWTHHLLVNAADLDWRCVCMTYVTLALYDVPAKVWHMDTLRMQVHSVLWTPVMQLRWFWFAKEQRAFPDAEDAADATADDAPASVESEPVATPGTDAPVHGEQVANQPPSQLRLF